MTLETPAPEAALAPPAGDSPPAGDQAPPAPAEQAPPGKPAPTVDPARFNREFTQRSQALASLRDEVGLPSSATPTEIVEAVRARLAAPSDLIDEDDPIMSDPRVLALQKQADDAALAYARTEYGEVADFTADLKALFRKEQNPAKQVEAVYEMLSRFAPTEEAPAAPAGEPSSTEAPPAEVGLGASEGESPSPIALDQAIVEEFKGTGNVAGFLNRIGLVGPRGG